MRFMAIVKPGKDYEAGKPPSPELMAAMGNFAQEQQKLGIFVMGGGLLPSAQGHRLSMSGGKITVTDGPFAETKEQLAGFYLVDARDLNDAIQIAAKIPPAREGSVEVRPVRELVV
jgi:hypothetical protein